MLANNPLVIFVLTLLAGLVSAADLVHRGDEKSGDVKKAWVLDKLESLLQGPLPTIPNVPPAIVGGVFAVLRFVLPLVGGSAVDYVVKIANSNSFFVRIESALSGVLNSLLGGSEPTPPAQ